MVAAGNLLNWLVGWYVAGNLLTKCGAQVCLSCGAGVGGAYTFGVVTNRLLPNRALRVLINSFGDVGVALSESLVSYSTAVRGCLRRMPYLYLYRIRAGLTIFVIQSTKKEEPTRVLGGLCVGSRGWYMTMTLCCSAGCHVD